MRHQLTFALVLAALSSTPALAYQMTTATIPGTSHTVYLNPSIPTLMPSHYARLQDAAMKVDANASAMRFVLALDDDAVQATNNGESEVDIISNTSTVCGSIACTIRWTSGGTITETDTFFSSTYLWALDDYKYNSISYDPARTRPLLNTAIHEFTHTLGAKHENAFFQVMGNAWNVVSTNGDYTESAMSEDTTAGLVSVYGYRSDSLEDLALYHWELAGASGEYSTHARTPLLNASGVALTPLTGYLEPAYSITKGTTIQVRQTAENRGKTSQTVPVRWYLSTDDLITTLDQQVASTTLTIAMDNPTTFNQTVTIPATQASGTYWIGAIIDPDNAVTERNKVNNAIYVAEIVIP
jgi:CARDB protein